MLAAAFSMDTFATDRETLEDERDAAGVRYYEPISCGLHDSLARGIHFGEISDGLSLTQAKWLDAWYESAKQLSIEFGIPWEAVMAQAVVDSAAGTSEAARELNNFFDLKDNRGDLLSFETPAAGLRAYFEKIQRDSKKYSSNGIFADSKITDPQDYLEAYFRSENISQEQQEKYMQYVEAIEDRAKMLEWSLSSSLASEYPEMKRNAAINYSGKNEDYVLGDSCGCSSENGSSGLRWNDGFIVQSTLPGYASYDVIGSGAEVEITGRGYGLSFKTENSKQGTFGPNNIKFRFVDPTESNAFGLYPNGDFPHFAVDLRHSRSYQYFSTKLSAAALEERNREGSIVIDLIGYFGDKNDDSGWNLANDKYTDEKWDYLATLLKGLHEQYGIELKGEQGENAEIWQKLASSLSVLAENGDSKCAMMDDSDLGLSASEMKRIANSYNMEKLESGYLEKNSDVAFVSYFVRNYTKIGQEQREWGNGGELAYLLHADYPFLGEGVDPKPLAVFSVDSGNILCGEKPCGHTGIVAAIKEGRVTTLEASYPDGKVEIKTYSIDYFKNSSYAYPFTYLQTVIDGAEIERGR